MSTPQENLLQHFSLATPLRYEATLRVLQVKKCPIVIASKAKQSQSLRLLRFALYETLRERNNGFWIIYFLEHFKRLVCTP